jgi:hypothetical protein
MPRAIVIVLLTRTRTTRRTTQAQTLGHIVEDVDRVVDTYDQHVSMTLP